VRYINDPQPTLFQIGKMEFYHLLRLADISLSNLFISRDNSLINNIHIFVSQKNLENLNSNLPHSGFNYVEGYLLNQNTYDKIKLKYRGDSLFHWSSYKKSLRIKTSKKSLFNGMRDFNLIVPRTPQILNNYLSYHLGSLMGLISPKTELVDLFINDELSGIYILTEQLSESTLRRSFHMPGDIYSGEFIGLDHYHGIERNLFVHPHAWEKVATSNRFAENQIKPIVDLIELMKLPPSDISQKELEKLLDVEAFGRFNALEILLQTTHMDNIHNWRLYYDPWRHRLIPVVWDPMGWSSHLSDKNSKPKYDIISSDLHLILYKNSNFIRARNKALYDFFDNGYDNLFLQDVRNSISSLKHSVYNDPNLYFDLNYLTPDRVNKEMEVLYNHISKVFRDLKEEYYLPHTQPCFALMQGDGIISLSIPGRIFIKGIVFKYNSIIKEKPYIKIIYLQNNTKLSEDIPCELNQNKDSIEINVPLIAQYHPIIKNMDPGKGFENTLDIKNGYYELHFINKIYSENKLLQVLVKVGNSNLISAKRVHEIEKTSFDNMYQIVNPPPLHKDTIWEGNVIVEGIKDINEELIIKPGANVLFKSGAGLVLHNKLIAEGTKEQPIKFLSFKDNQYPWCTVALDGTGAKGSILSYCEFNGGSGYKSDLIEYTAMFSIHDVPGLVVDHCRFYKSKLTDDMVHAVYSDVQFNECKFENSPFDALDLDMSKGIIENCIFENSGNDSIDAMTTHVIVRNTTLRNSNDKGISAGEGSHVLATNVRFIKNQVGVQSKDDSRVVLYNCDLINNACGLDAYLKIWRYENGGKIFCYKSKLSGNLMQIKAEKKSQICLYDSYIDSSIKQNKRIVIDRTVDSEYPEKASTQSLWRYPDEINSMKDFQTIYWKGIDCTRRGAYLQ